MTTASGPTIAIVGGGVIGCSIAYQLTRRGIADVVLLERSRLASGATGICPGGIRQQFETEADCLLAQRSVKFYERINEHLGPEPPFYFERSGYLFVADSPATLARFEQNVAMQNGLGIPSRMVGPADIAKLLPAARLAGVAGGAFCAEDGFIEDCDGVTNALARNARARGARVVYDEVGRLESTGATWRVHARRGTIEAHAVVIAAGADSVELLEPLGIQLPIVRERRRLAYTAPAPAGLVPPLVAALERGFAIKQLANGVCYLGWLGDRPDIDDLEFIERSLRAAVEMWPFLEHLGVRRVVAGTYDTTPDHRPILGGTGRAGLYVAAGFSGHGFMLAPAVGGLIADLAAGGPPDPLLEDFAPGRFGRRTADEGLQI